MPEKTKLEDYSNMNNTGFAFIDLNEELNDNDLNSKDFTIDEKLYNKFNEIYESGKALFLRIKSKYIGGGVYYELMNYKNTIIYKENDNLYLSTYFGDIFSRSEGKINYNDGMFFILRINIIKNSSNNFAMSIYTEG